MPLVEDGGALCCGVLPEGAGETGWLAGALVCCASTLRAAKGKHKSTAISNA